MRIRRYKGTSQEKLLNAARRELGADAVVVCNRKIDGGPGGLFGKRQYEVIAVADESHDGSRPVVAESRAGEGPSALEGKRWNAIEERFTALQDEIRNISTGLEFPGGADVPAFARGWDPGFTRVVKRNIPDLFVQNPDEDALERLSDSLNVMEDFSPKRGKGPHVVVLAGPTGSGKTTTLAKLAANWHLERGLKVGMITTDTYRIAAVDQIREYAALLGTELRVAFSAAEAARAADSFKSMDVVLVDTPGRNHYDSVGMAGLRGTMERFGKVTLMLLVPATIDSGYARTLVESFRVVKPDCLVVSKIDETRRWPIFTTLARVAPWPVAFLTNGQSVPQDIKPARADVIARMLVEGGSGDDAPPVAGGAYVARQQADSRRPVRAAEHSCESYEGIAA